jgi:acetyl-CoA carboxylase biotin carboxyl carrier protein
MSYYRMILVVSHKNSKGCLLMKVQEIRELIKLVDQSSIDEFVYENGDAKIKMKKRLGVTMVEQAPTQAVLAPVVPQPVQQPAHVQPQPAPVEHKEPTVAEVKEEQKPSVEDTNLHKITSPMVGTFYQAPAPDADPYVKVGSKVTKDTVVCIVEAMKLFNEIEAEVDGEIVEVLVKDGQLVEYGQPLFLVKPE